MINGRLPEAPVTFDTRKGERLRLRFLNSSGASAYRVAIGGHRMAITHTDPWTRSTSAWANAMTYW